MWQMMVLIVGRLGGHILIIGGDVMVIFRKWVHYQRIKKSRIILYKLILIFIEAHQIYTWDWCGVLSAFL